MTEDTESALEAELKRSRARLIRNGQRLSENLTTTFDVLRPVRRAPLGGLLASLATGIMVGAVRSAFVGRGSVSRNGDSPKARGTFLQGLLLRSVPALGPMIAPMFLKFLQSRRSR